MIRGIAASLVLAALVSVPQSASADSPIGSRDFGIICTHGLFPACASVDIWTAANAVGGTSLFATIGNVQGSPGFESLSPAGLLQFSFGGLSLDLTDCVIVYDMGCDPIAGFHSSWRPWMFERLGSFSSGSREEGLGPDGGPASYMPAFIDSGEQTYSWNGTHASVGYRYWDDDGFAHYGCDAPQLTPNNLDLGGNSVFRLCNRSFEYEFNFGPGVDLALTPDTYFEALYYTAEGVEGCSTAHGAVDRCARVPEPSTYLLMLTGITGLGLVAWRRGDVEAYSGGTQDKTKPSSFIGVAITAGRIAQ